MRSLHAFTSYNWRSSRPQWLRWSTPACIPASLPKASKNQTVRRRRKRSRP